MTLDELKVALNINEDDEVYDDKVEGLYALAKKIFTQYTRVNLVQETTTETMMDFYGKVIYPNNTPVTSVTSINTTAEINGDETEITDYLLVNNAIYLSDSIDVTSLVLEYDAGHSTIPTEIDYILVKILSYWWKSDDQKTMISSSGEMLLEPSQIVLPKLLREAIAIYRVGI